MVTRHGVKRFIKAALPEIQKRLEAGYTIKEIHADLPDLANNISYSSTLRNLQQMGICEKHPHQSKTPKIENFGSKTGSNYQKAQSNEERNTEKLLNRNKGFSYDPNSHDKNLF